MLNLNQFPCPPTINSVTACESDGTLRALESSDTASAIAQLLSSHNIEVAIGQECARSAQSKYEAKEAFAAHTETMIQRLTSSYYEEGVCAMLKQLASEKDGVPNFLTHFVTTILRIFDSLSVLRRHIPISYCRQPSLCQSTSVNVGIISRICCHPHTKTLAVVFADDTIRIFGSGQTLTPLLKHRMQKNITDIRWMPYYVSMLAVGCSSGILIWTLDPVSVVARPSGSSLYHMKHSAVTPVLSLSYHPKGVYLACVGGEGRELVICDTLTQVTQTVFSGLATSLTKVLWSPDGSKLLVAMSSNSIRIFETRTWTSERWSLEQPMQSAAWSSCGRCLLFSTVGQSILFSLSFGTSSDGTVSGARIATPIGDFSSQLVSNIGGEEVYVGGMINEVCWDPTSERLVVLFEDSEYIALVHTIVSPQLHVAPGGFIKGSFGQLPVYAQFQNNVNNGAVLSMVWSNGKVTHLPLQYTPRSKPSYPERANISLNNSTANHTLNQTLFHHTSLRQSLVNQHTFSSPAVGTVSGNISLFTSPITADLFSSP